MSVAVSNKNSQPGTTWDMYGVKASESPHHEAPGALQPSGPIVAGMGFAAASSPVAVPPRICCRAYYRVVAILSGDLKLRACSDRSRTVARTTSRLLNDYLTQSAGSAQPARYLHPRATASVSPEGAGGIDPATAVHGPDKLRASCSRNYPSYQSAAGNTNDWRTCSRRPA